MNIQLMDPRMFGEQMGFLEVLVVALFTHRGRRQFWLFFLPFRLWNFLRFELARSVSNGFEDLFVRARIVYRKVVLLVEMPHRKGQLAKWSRSYQQRFSAFRMLLSNVGQQCSRVCKFGSALQAGQGAFLELLRRSQVLEDVEFAVSCKRYLGFFGGSFHIYLNIIIY